ncbi:MAG TPA: response regulator [Planctomycetota bacterium]|nr:response regulator [Planctomycetota bacterium]
MKDSREQTVIVLIDDEPEVLSALRRSLRNEPYEVLSTSRPGEALRWVESLDVGAVVSDERMPEMKGTDLLARVSERSPATARILLTSYAVETARRPRLGESIECMIAKPWDETMLRATIRELLWNREPEDPLKDIFGGSGEWDPG